MNDPKLNKAQNAVITYIEDSYRFGRFWLFGTLVSEPRELTAEEAIKYCREKFTKGCLKPKIQHKGVDNYIVIDINRTIRYRRHEYCKDYK